MSNQHTMILYTKGEISNIIKQYQDGISYTVIAQNFKRSKRKIKEILIQNEFWIEGRDVLKKDFSDEIINEIVKIYKNGSSCQKISERYDISITPIKRILRERNLLRNGYSDGKKINLTEEQEKEMKRMYIEDFKTSPEISKKLGLNIHFIEKTIFRSRYNRTKGESISLRQKGKKRSENVCNIMKLAQQKFARSGNRKQTGGVCKRFIVDGLKCTGTYEKFYIEKLKKENKRLPENFKSISTPYGAYYPDFINCGSYIEIKSDYTYDVLIGKKESRWTKKIELSQYNKIKWVNENIKPVDILVVDKINNKIIKKEIS